VRKASLSNNKEELFNVKIVVDGLEEARVGLYTYPRGYLMKPCISFAAL
jgi:hypothetical protein